MYVDCSFWLEHVAIVLLMQSGAVSVECLLLYPCCVVMCEMLSVMYGKSVNVFYAVCYVCV